MTVLSKKSVAADGALLGQVTGEFRDPAREALFRAERLPEMLRQARLVMMIAVIMNSLFLITDWRFWGTDHFWIAVPARLAIILLSFGAFFLLRRVDGFAYLQRVLTGWQWTVGALVGVLVSSHSELALFVVLLLPLMFYLTIPVSFRYAVASGIGCSLFMLAGFIQPDEPQAMALGLFLAMVMLNSAMILVVLHSNRLRRLNWAAIESHRRVAEALAASRQQLEQIFMAVPLPLVVTDQSGSLIQANEVAARYFGMEKRVYDTATVDAAFVHAEDRAAFRTLLRCNGTVIDFETRFHLHGTTRNVLLAATRTEIGGRECYLTSIVDITARKAMEVHLERLATTDTLTGVANRSQFLRIAERAMSATRERFGRLAVVLLDVDDFKEINDTLGHDAGDTVLAAVAERLRESLRQGDVVARLGGDEFALLLADIDDDGVLDRILDSLAARLSEPLIYQGRIVECCASMGVAIYPAHAVTVEELTKNADIALYVAKSAGRGGIRSFTPDMRSVIERRSEVLRLARAALADDRIEAFYQPKVNLETGCIQGFEALLRWHDSAGYRRPGALTEAFEDFDLAIALGDRMFDRVLRDMRGWLQQGVDFGHIAINLSAAEFRRDDVAERILGRLAAAGIPPTRLEVEVTETVFLGRGSDHVGRALRLLSDAGVTIALDDFGTGYASLSHLKQFPVDVIKIDKSFIANLADTSSDTAIVRAVMGLGHSLGIRIVAEGIETEQQAACLRAEGCDIGQGFLFSEAMSPTQVVMALRKTGHRVLTA